MGVLCLCPSFPFRYFPLPQHVYAQLHQPYRFLLLLSSFANIQLIQAAKTLQKSVELKKNMSDNINEKNLRVDEKPDEAKKKSEIKFQFFQTIYIALSVTLFFFRS